MAGDDEADDTFEALSHGYRRFALAALAEPGSALAIADLAADVAAREHDEAIDDLSAEVVTRTRRQLHHVHVPKLDDLGFVEYDRENRVVTLAERSETALSLLSVISDRSNGDADDGA